MPESATCALRVRCCGPTAVIRAGCCGFGVYSGVQVSAKLRPSDVLPPFLHESLFSLRPERYDLREVANTARSPHTSFARLVSVSYASTAPSVSYFITTRFYRGDPAGSPLFALPCL